MISVTQQYVPVIQVLVKYVLSTYILLAYQSLTLRGLFPAVSFIHVSLSEGRTLLCGSLRLHLQYSLVPFIIHLFPSRPKHIGFIAVFVREVDGLILIGLVARTVL